MRAGNPWKAIFSFASLHPADADDLFSGNIFVITSSVTAISFGSPLNAAQRNGPFAFAKQAGEYMQVQSRGNQMHSSGQVLASFASCTYIVAIIKSDSAFVLQLQHQLHMEVHSVRKRIQYIVLDFLRVKFLPVRKLSVMRP